ncbi:MULTISPECIES: YIP1 family protein [Bacillus]|uniref:Yip1 domain-containing protein n=1 Tax=Bacillus cereus TaxID=1396 RepID=A0A9X6B3P5_BACCE|nr:YIP1 family protein [Bacillus cereus]OOR71471.1 hypothetical protein BLX06_30505 [Bacillus cereus]
MNNIVLFFTKPRVFFQGKNKVLFPFLVYVLSAMVYLYSVKELTIQKMALSFKDLPPNLAIDVHNTTFFMIVYGFSLVFLILSFIVLSVIVFLGLKIFKKKMSYRETFSLLIHIYIPIAIGNFIVGLLNLLTGNHFTNFLYFFGVPSDFISLNIFIFYSLFILYIVLIEKIKVSSLISIIITVFVGIMMAINSVGGSI